MSGYYVSRGFGNQVNIDMSRDRRGDEIMRYSRSPSPKPGMLCCFPKHSNHYHDLKQELDAAKKNKDKQSKKMEHANCCFTFHKAKRAYEVYAEEVKELEGKIEEEKRKRHCHGHCCGSCSFD